MTDVTLQCKFGADTRSLAASASATVGEVHRLIAKEFGLGQVKLVGLTKTKAADSVLSAPAP